jgi:FkbM family methyltransferase
MLAKKILRAVTPPILLNIAKSVVRRNPVAVSKERDNSFLITRKGGAINGGRAAYAVATDERFERAQKYGLTAERYQAFMDDPDGAVKIAPLFVYGANKQVKFPPEAKWFIIESMFEDAYFLEQLPVDANANLKIIDIGANVGAFAIAARTRFPMATIHCYEPNPDLEKFLAVQAFATRSKVFMVGVGKEAGSFAIDNRQNEILGHDSVMMMNFNKSGNIPIVPFQNCLDNIGGYADLVKLDCEGSEWVITSDPKPFKRVRFVAMEYHRLPLDGSFDEFDLGINIHDVAKQRVSDLGFSILHHVENSIDAGIIVAKNESFT